MVDGAEMESEMRFGHWSSVAENSSLRSKRQPEAAFHGEFGVCAAAQWEGTHF